MSINREHINKLISRGHHQQALWVYLAQKAHQADAQRLVGEYIPTAKNALVQDFYPSRGFAQITTNDGPIRFQANLDKLSTNYADYLQVKEH